MEAQMFVQPMLQARAASRDGAVFLEELSAMLARILSGLVREWRIRRDLARLVEFDDRMLHDIGLGRSEVEPALRYGRSFPEPASQRTR
jgi:uncharacterized protein YjiS (DUF1127 family)